jgi:predicted metalloprotease with PDZ domain
MLSRKHVSRTAFVAALALSVPVAPSAGQTPVSPTTSAALISAPVADVRYVVSFDSTDAQRRVFRVEMTFVVRGPGDVVLSLPVWTPGSYELSNFAQYVSGFTASDRASKRALDWSKADANTWRIAPNGARQIGIAFEFQVVSVGVDGAHAEPDFGFVNGTNLFMYPEGRPFDWRSAVTVRTSPQWRVATSMRSAPGAEPNGERRYEAASYHELVDMPFFIGRFDLDSALISGRWLRLATYPAGAVGEHARGNLWRALQAIVPAEVALFRHVPWDSYTALMMIDRNAALATALEHRSSFLGVYSPLIFGQVALRQILAHEILHAWNGARIRPSELMPFPYDRERRTSWLWVVEGVTDYYADLVITRAGLIDSTGFLGLTSPKMQLVASAPPASVRDVSLSAWNPPSDGTRGLEYPKGSLIALLLDILIRDASDNARSLDDIMRDIDATTTKSGRGYTAEDWWGAVSRAAGGRSFSDFSRRYVEGRETLPYDSVFRLAGMRASVDTTRLPRLGMTVVADTGVWVTSVDSGGTAFAAGIRKGDRLVKAGDVDVITGGYGVQFRVRYKDAEGQRIAFIVRRGAETMTLSAPLQFAARVNGQVSFDATASPKALRIRRSLLTGNPAR